MNMTVKKGDNVLVITGKDKGKTGKVLEVFPEKNKVLVDGVNVVSKHKKARNQNEQSGIIKQNAAIDASNVMVVCPSCGKATRVHHKEIDGKKVRVCKCGVSLDKDFVKATKKDAKKVSKAVKEPAEKPQAKAEQKTATKTVEKSVKTTKTAEKTTKTVEKTTKNAEKTTKSAAKPAKVEKTAKTEVKAEKTAKAAPKKAATKEKSTKTAAKKA